MSEPYTAYEEDAINARAQSHPAGGASHREPRSYLPTLVVANIGLLMAMLTPIVASMAFKLQHITSNAAEAAGALGLVLGIGALFALFANPLFGRLSDRTRSRFGMRRPWLVGGALVASLALALIGFAGTVWLVLVGWCIAQIAFNAVLAAMNATVPDQVPAARRGRVSGIVGIGVSFAILGGIGLANLLAADWARFTVPGLIGLVTVAGFALLLRDRRLIDGPAERLNAKQFFASFVFDPRKSPDFGWVWVTRFLVGFAYVGVGAFLPLYLSEHFKLAERQALAVIGIATLASTVTGLISGPLGGWLSDRLGRRRIFVAVAGVILCIGLFVLAFAPNVTWVVIAQAIIGFGGGCFFAVDIALATQVLPNPADTAKDLGVMSIANALPQSLAPVIAPPIIALGALTAIGGFAFFYLFAGVLGLGGALAVYRVRAVR